MIGSLNATPHVYSFTIQQLQTMLLSICGGITAISAAIAVIIKAINHAKAPDDKQNERLNAHDAELEKINRKLGADKDRLDLFQSKLVSLEEHQKENSITLEVHDRKILESEQHKEYYELTRDCVSRAFLFWRFIMMDIINELVSVIVRLVIAGAGTAFMAYGIPYLKKIGVYKLVQIAVRAAEKLGATGAIEKADKKKYVMEALERLGVKITPTIETMIEAAVKEMDIQNDKIKDEFKKN